MMLVEFDYLGFTVLSLLLWSLSCKKNGPIYIILSSFIVENMHFDKHGGVVHVNISIWLD